MASRAKKKKQSREGSLQTCGTFPFKGNDPNKLLEFVNQAQQRGTLKIRSSTEADGMFFASVSKHIRDKVGSIKEVKLYKSWIEIHWHK